MNVGRDFQGYLGGAQAVSPQPKVLSEGLARSGVQCRHPGVQTHDPRSLAMTVEPLDRGLFLIPLDLHARRLSDNFLSVSHRRLSCGQGRGSRTGWPKFSQFR